MANKRFRDIIGNDEDPLWIPTNVGRFSPSLDSNKWINLNEKFASSSTTDYLEYVALITQNSSNAPTAIVLNSEASNYLGEIVWSYDAVGSYIGTLAGINEAGSYLTLQISPTSLIVVMNGLNPIEYYIYQPLLILNDENSVYLNVINTSDHSLSDGGLLYSTIIIRKYIL